MKEICFFFQAEMYAINRLANIIKEKDIKNKTIYILSASKSSLQALEKDETCTLYNPNNMYNT